MSASVSSVRRFGRRVAQKTEGSWKADSQICQQKSQVALQKKGENYKKWDESIRIIIFD